MDIPELEIELRRLEGVGLLQQIINNETKKEILLRIITMIEEKKEIHKIHKKFIFSAITFNLVIKS